jgi:hypothetical protein
MELHIFKCDNCGERFEAKYEFDVLGQAKRGNYDFGKWCDQCLESLRTVDETLQETLTASLRKEAFPAMDQGAIYSVSRWYMPCP